MSNRENMEDMLCFRSEKPFYSKNILIAPIVFMLIPCYLSLKCLSLCVVTVLSTVPTALSAEYPACDPSYWAFQLLARSISAKGEQ